MRYWHPASASQAPPTISGASASQAQPQLPHTISQLQPLRLDSQPLPTISQLQPLGLDSQPPPTISRASQPLRLNPSPQYLATHIPYDQDDDYNVEVEEKEERRWRRRRRGLSTERYWIIINVIIITLLCLYRKMAEGRQRLRPWLRAKINSGQVPGLSWIPRAGPNVFRISWKHGGKQDWNPQDGQLFLVYLDFIYISGVCLVLVYYIFRTFCTGESMVILLIFWYYKW